MLIEIFKSKIHRVRVTQADRNYVGSVTIDEELLEAANIFEGARSRLSTTTTASASKHILLKVKGAAV